MLLHLLLVHVLLLLLLLVLLLLSVGSFCCGLLLRICGAAGTTCCAGRELWLRLVLSGGLLLGLGCGSVALLLLALGCRGTRGTPGTWVGRGLLRLWLLLLGRRESDWIRSGASIFLTCVGAVWRLLGRVLSFGWWWCTCTCWSCL